MPISYYFDPTYILVIIGLILTLAASAKVQRTFSKYSKVSSLSGVTGAHTASMLLKSKGVNDVRIERVSGDLTDHFDPRNKVLRLSDTVYGKRSEEHTS